MPSPTLQAALLSQGGAKGKEIVLPLPVTDERKRRKGGGGGVTTIPARELSAILGIADRLPSTFFGENPSCVPEPLARAEIAPARPFARNVDLYAPELDMHKGVLGAWVAAQAPLIDGLPTADPDLNKGFAHGGTGGYASSQPDLIEGA
jgi:hypothetical protein